MILLIVSKNGHLDVVKYLVEECHCDVEEKDNNGLTPLHIACAKGYLDIVKYLVEDRHCNVEVIKDILRKIPFRCVGNKEVREYLEQKSKETNNEDTFTGRKSKKEKDKNKMVIQETCPIIKFINS